MAFRLVESLKEKLRLLLVERAILANPEGLTVFAYFSPNGEQYYIVNFQNPESAPKMFDLWSVVEKFAGTEWLVLDESGRYSTERYGVSEV